MKKLAFIFILFPMLGFSQSDTLSLESLKKQILSLRSEQENIKLNLRKHSKQFTMGTVSLITGAGLIFFNSMVERDEDSIYYIGGGLMTLGTFVHIDSHKWFGRTGGKRKRTSKSLLD